MQVCHKALDDPGALHSASNSSRENNCHPESGGALVGLESAKAFDIAKQFPKKRSKASEELSSFREASFCTSHALRSRRANDRKLVGRPAAKTRIRVMEGSWSISMTGVSRHTVDNQSIVSYSRALCRACAAEDREFGVCHIRIGFGPPPTHRDTCGEFIACATPRDNSALLGWLWACATPGWSSQRGCQGESENMRRGACSSLSLLSDTMVCVRAAACLMGKPIMHPKRRLRQQLSAVVDRHLLEHD